MTNVAFVDDELVGIKMLMARKQTSSNIQIQPNCVPSVRWMEIAAKEMVRKDFPQHDQWCDPCRGKAQLNASGHSQ